MGKVSKECTRVTFKLEPDSYPPEASKEPTNSNYEVRLDLEDLERFGIVTVSQCDMYTGEVTLPLAILEEIVLHCKGLGKKTKGK